MLKNSFGFLLVIFLTRLRVLHSKYLAGILICGLSLFSSFSSYGQIFGRAESSGKPDSVRKNRHYGQEICLGVGFLSNNDINQTETQNRQTKTITSFTGTWSLRYRRWFGNIALGMSVAYENVSGKWEEWAPYPNASSGTFRQDIWSIAPECMWAYRRTQYKPLRVYGYVSLGISLWNERDYYSGVIENVSKSIGAIQFSPVGISYGDRYRAFVELGYGYRGIVNVGASVQFGKSRNLVFR